MASVLDWALIIIYMLSMVGVGMYFKTDDSMQDFAVADKKLGLSVMTATMLATAVGGGALTGSVGNSYMNGIVEVPKIIILLCINLFMGLFVAKKMRNIGGFTAPEMLGRVYGKKCQTLGGLFCAIYMMGTGPAMQSIALGTCIHLLLGVNMKVGMIIGMAIILAYTLSSGMWGVAMTDYVQFIFLAGGVLLATAMVYSGAGGWSGITSSVPAEHLQLDTSGAIKLICATSLPVLIAAIPQCLLLVMSLVMGLAAVVLLPADLPKDMVFATLLMQYLPTGIKGLCIAALMAAIMSTADSYMLSGATNISVDIYKTYINPKATDKQMLIVTKVGILAVGLLGLGFALLLPDVMSVWTLSSTAYVGGCLVPMLYGIFGSGKKSYIGALISMIGGGAVALICDLNKIVIFGLPAIVYGIIVSAVLFFGITPFAKDAKIVDIRK